MRNFARTVVLSRTVVLGLAVILTLLLGHGTGQAAEQRFALVIGNDEYKAVKLATPANDAGLVADALQAAGFTVTGARNLDQATLRESFREFLGQVSAAGPDAVALVYLAGIGLQFQGDNYFVPVDADIQHDVDVPLQAIRISDFTQPLAALPGRVKIVILDAARQNPFVGGNQPLASGLALVDPVPTTAIAFNAAPGTVAPDEPGPYGAYATSLTEMIAAGGLGLDDIFARLRLRVSDLTQGAEVPWYVSQIDGPFYMTERAADAPPPPNVMPIADIRAKSIRDFSGVEDAYAWAVDRDTIEGYEQFLALYPSGPYSGRIHGMLAVRREEIIWRRCVVADTPPAYWSYMRRYPQGPHIWDARRRLEMLRQALEPPPAFVDYDFGVPPPPPAEFVFVDQPVVMFVGPRSATAAATIECLGETGHSAANDGAANDTVDGASGAAATASRDDSRTGTTSSAATRAAAAASDRGNIGTATAASGAAATAAATPGYGAVATAAAAPGYGTITAATAPGSAATAAAATASGAATTSAATSGAATAATAAATSGRPAARCQAAAVSAGQAPDA
jgi:uncharacterized caspase-like protein